MNRKNQKGDEDMILGEKIALLRKKNNYSQEDLANELGISRQSVSKWESGNSIPDLDKIIKISSLFGVSTDYLLKDELEEATPSETDEMQEEGKTISLEEANKFLEATLEFAKKISFGISLCILSPILLIILGGMAETGIASMTEDMAAGFGTAVLLLLVAAGTVIIVMTGISYGKYEYLEKEKIMLQYGVAGIVNKRKTEFAETFQRNVAFGVGTIIVGIIPVMIASGFGASEFVEVICVGILLAAVALGVHQIVWAGIIQGSFQKLLQEEDYSEENKNLKKKTGSFAGIYWCFVTAVYLGYTLWNNSWGTSWIIWPVAGVLFAALNGIFVSIVKNNQKVDS